ncbi:g5875 [Coccomyxa viridis]|uniref:G5875 protein n=1 Tax=Coccomyxa viridis TaxID=1274662 RepID=A0ABP1FU10_9CHLO
MCAHDAAESQPASRRAGAPAALCQDALERLTMKDTGRDGVSSRLRGQQCRLHNQCGQLCSTVNIICYPFKDFICKEGFFAIHFRCLRPSTM